MYIAVIQYMVLIVHVYNYSTVLYSDCNFLILKPLKEGVTQKHEIIKNLKTVEKIMENKEKITKKIFKAVLRVKNTVENLM